MLNETEKLGLKRDLEKIAKANAKTLDEVYIDFEAALKTALLIPRVKTKSRKKQLKSARGILDTTYNNQESSGEPFVFWPFGPKGDVKDWNSTIFDDNNTELQRGNMPGLIAEGRVMILDGKPVSKIIKYDFISKFVDPVNNKVHDEDGEGREELKKVFNVTEAEFWKKGEVPVWRDNRISYGNKTNLSFGQPLQHSWAVTLEGIGYPSDKKDYRLVSIDLRYNQANPLHADFFFKKFKMFQCYIANFEIDKLKTTDWRYVLKKRGKLVPKATTVEMVDRDGDDIDLDDLIETVFASLRQFDEKANKVQIGKNFDCIPDYLKGYSDIEEYHTGRLGGELGEPSDYFEGAVKRTPNGHKITSKSGWDTTRWNKYAIMAVGVSAANEPSSTKGSYSYSLEDAAAPKNMKWFKAWAGKTIFDQPDLPGKCLMMVKSSRKPTRYDRETKTTVDDLVNGDLSFTALSIARLDAEDKPIDVEMKDVIVS